MKCRYSPPSFMKCRPLRGSVSLNTYDVSVRPGKRCRSSEIQIARDDHLRSNRTCDAVSDAEIDRIERPRRKVPPMRTLRPKRARSERAPEHVRLVDREDARSRM
jgi:hypothetical protein